MTVEELLACLTGPYSARGSKRQKSAFLPFICAVFQSLGYPVAVQRRAGSRNVLIGDLENAELIVTAHYDTPRQNVVNVRMYLDHPRRKQLKYLFPELLSALCAWRRNPVNANDNSSGILGVFAVLAERPSGVCGVLFDNEEKGALGSSVYWRRYKSLRQKPHVNLDCIGVGGEFCVLYNKGCRSFGERLAACGGGSRHIVCEKDGAAKYYSDNKALDNAVTVAAFLTDRRGLRYNDRIHTRRDTRIDPGNIAYVKDLILKFAGTFGLPPAYDNGGGSMNGYESVVDGGGGPLSHDGGDPA